MENIRIRFYQNKFDRNVFKIGIKLIFIIPILGFVLLCFLDVFNNDNFDILISTIFIYCICYLLFIMIFCNIYYYKYSENIIMLFKFPDKDEWFGNGVPEDYVLVKEEDYIK